MLYSKLYDRSNKFLVAIICNIQQFNKKGNNNNNRCIRMSIRIK